MQLAGNGDYLSASAAAVYAVCHGGSYIVQGVCSCAQGSGMLRTVVEFFIETFHGSVSMHYSK